MNDLISVIVSTYNREDALDVVLRALSRQTDRNFEIVVADFSEPGTIRRVAQGTSTIRSTVLPALEVAAAAVFLS